MRLGWDVVLWQPCARTPGYLALYVYVMADTRRMAHFRVAACLSFKASPGAQPFKWQLVAYSHANQTHFHFNS